MKLARVIGTVVSTQKVAGLKNTRIMMVQPLDDILMPDGRPIAAIDAVQSGTGDLVYLTLSREASLACPDSFVPVDAAITGIVDKVNKDEAGIKNKESIFGKGKNT